MATFECSAFDNHERVLFCNDEGAGLRAIIAIHSTALGPAAGGCRLWQYASDDDALRDVLRLSRGMSYKNAMARLRFGGGKAVILKGGPFRPDDALFEKFGDFVEQLHGDYITAEDVGMSVAIMQTIARRTQYVSGLPPDGQNAGGDPSPKTARGVLRGMEAAVRCRLQRDSLSGLRVAVQGIGNVGYYLCSYLHDAGARLVVSDIDDVRAHRACKEFSATAVDPDDILLQDVDVVAPCALGAVLNETSIPLLRAPIVAGGANNQLASDTDGQRLSNAGILYAPDYVINGGGIINVACEYYGNCSEAEVLRQVDAIGPRLEGIFEQSQQSGRPTNEIADEQARQLIRNPD